MPTFQELKEHFDKHYDGLDDVQLKQSAQTDYNKENLEILLGNANFKDTSLLNLIERIIFFIENDSFLATDESDANNKISQYKNEIIQTINNHLESTNITDVITNAKDKFQELLLTYFLAKATDENIQNYFFLYIYQLEEILGTEDSPNISFTLSQSSKTIKRKIDINLNSLEEELNNLEELDFTTKGDLANKLYVLRGDLTVLQDLNRFARDIFEDYSSKIEQENIEIFQLLFNGLDKNYFQDTITELEKLEKQFQEKEREFNTKHPSTPKKNRPKINNNIVRTILMSPLRNNNKGGRRNMPLTPVSFELPIDRSIESDNSLDWSSESDNSVDWPSESNDDSDPDISVQIDYGFQTDNESDSTLQDDSLDSDNNNSTNNKSVRISPNDKSTSSQTDDESDSTLQDALLNSDNNNSTNNISVPSVLFPTDYRRSNDSQTNNAVNQNKNKYLNSTKETLEECLKTKSIVVTLESNVGKNQPHVVILEKYGINKNVNTILMKFGSFEQQQGNKLDDISDINHDNFKKAVKEEFPIYKNNNIKNIKLIDKKDAKNAIKHNTEIEENNAILFNNKGSQINLTLIRKTEYKQQPIYIIRPTIKGASLKQEPIAGVELRVYHESPDQTPKIKIFYNNQQTTIDKFSHEKVAGYNMHNEMRSFSLRKILEKFEFNLTTRNYDKSSEQFKQENYRFKLNNQPFQKTPLSQPANSTNATSYFKTNDGRSDSLTH